MFSCLQILEAFLWFVLITLLNVTLIILTLSVSRLLNLLLRLRSEERFSRNAETDLVCRLLLEKKINSIQRYCPQSYSSVAFSIARGSSTQLFTPCFTIRPDDD